MQFYQGDIYTTTIRCLFSECQNSIFDKHYRVWIDSFSKIHGVFDSQRKINFNKLETLFHISLYNSQERLFQLVFCIETYYSAILRMMAYKAVFKISMPFSDNIFQSTSFVEKGIMNYSCVDYYNWFLLIDKTKQTFSDLYSEVEFLQAEQNCDLVSDIFESIFPKEIRHSIGEYYTPYWLASYIIDNVTSQDEERHLKKYIDPSCGSGTFLIALIHKFKNASNNSIFNNICGIDINPLAVLAAKTNFLLAYSKVSDFNEELEIPIYYADTIATNTAVLSLFDDETGYDTVPETKYDYIVGNPPWVNWEYLPEFYKKKHCELWRYYNLFDQKGLNANFIKEDISVLMTYVAIDNYLKIGGRLGFVIKESLFKSIKQGEGFRKFKIYPSNTELCVYRVDDLTNIKPFKGAVTRTALLYLKKGEKTLYPVDYVVWHPTNRNKSIQTLSSSASLTVTFEFEQLKARPSVPCNPNSGWITENAIDTATSKHILGTNNYTARTGVFTGGANAIYWLRIESEVSSNTVAVSNITEKAKNKMQSVSTVLEKDFVFPLLTGSDLHFWNYSYSKYILCPHTPKTKMRPVGKEIIIKLPKTEAYLLSFKKELEERKGFTKMDEQIHLDYFYTLQRIGEYTFSKYKVCWRYISKHFTPAVVEYAEDNYLGKKNIICNEKIISIGLNDRDEAYYLCGVISSKPYRETIENYMIGTQITPSIINNLNIPHFDRNDTYHRQIAKLCLEGHLSENKVQYADDLDKTVYDWIITRKDAKASFATHFYHR